MKVKYRGNLALEDEFKEFQKSLFPNVDIEDIQNTLFLLKKYPYMKMLVRDYEENAAELKQTDIEGETARKLSDDEVYSNKTANAVIFAEKQLLIYHEYKTITRTVERAHRLIMDEQERLAVQYRYLEGLSYKESLMFFKRSMSERTFDRRLFAGVESMANTLKLWGVLDREWKY